MKKHTTIVALALALALTVALAGTALAHAKLSSSMPAAGAKLTAAPAKVALVFSEEVSDKVAETYLTVADAKGTNIASGKLDTADVDHKTLSAALPGGLGDGVYTVTWRATTPDDGGITIGKFSFGVNADPGPQTNVAGEEQEAAATASPTAAATTIATRAATTAATSAATATRAATALATPRAATTTAMPAAATTLPNTGGDQGGGALIAAAILLLAVGALALRKLRLR